MKRKDLTVGESYWHGTQYDYEHDRGKRAVVLSDGPHEQSTDSWSARRRDPYPVASGQGVLVDLYDRWNDDTTPRRTVVYLSKLRGPWEATKAESAAMNDAREKRQQQEDMRRAASSKAANAAVERVRTLRDGGRISLDPTDPLVGRATVHYDGIGYSVLVSPALLNAVLDLIPQADTP
jgi:hypothetical protein